MPLHNDEPTLSDLLDRSELVKQVAEEIAGCDPPTVFGIHGSWGSGKTSFLLQLQCALTGECQHLGIAKAKEAKNLQVIKNNDLTVVWFEAWRYQHDQMPIVALLQEIRAQLPMTSKFLDRAKKLGHVGIQSALFAIEGITKHIGVKASAIQKSGEQWEKDHYAIPLPSHAIRQQLEYAIDQIIGSPQGDSRPRLVVLIDDLDRCQGAAAYRLLEGIKIYLNLPNCVFVLGMNQQVIEDGISREFAGSEEDPGQCKTRAREYLEKLCQVIWHLPLIDQAESKLSHWMGAGDSAFIDEVSDLVKSHNLLPLNARKIKSFANTLQRFLHLVSSHIDENADEQKRELKVMLIMAYLYHFHFEIYQAIESNPNFYNEKLYIWADTEDRLRGGVHPVLRHVQSMFSNRDNSGVEKGTTKNPIFPHHDQANVLRAHGLILDPELGNVEIDLIRKFILQ